MTRFALALALFAAAPSALACGGEPCEHCNRHASAETAAVDVDAAAGTKITLSITGMHCGACATKITAALNGTTGVNAVSIDHETGRARIAFDEATVDVDGLIAAVATAGEFEASRIEEQG